MNAMVDGNMIVRMEVMIILHCAFCDAHQAIYRTLNQTVATRLRIGVYVFDNDGCQYPDRTMCGEAIDTRLFANNARVNKSIMHPIFIDEKKDRARKESRNHLSKVQGGYPVARILGTTDIPRYQELQKSSKPSSRDEPSGLSLGERSQSKPLQVQRASTSVTNKPSKLSTRDEPSGLSLGERSQVKPTPIQQDPRSSNLRSADEIPQSALTSIHDQTTICPNEQRKTYRSVLISSSPGLSAPDKRLVVDDAFYQPKSSVFERLRPNTTNNSAQNNQSHKRSNAEPVKPAKRLSVDTLDGMFLDPRTQRQSSIKIIRAPLTDSFTRKSVQVLPLPRSLNEMTNKPNKLPPSQATRQNIQGVKNIPSSENKQPRTVHNPKDNRPITRVQTTDSPTIMSTVHQPKPFKLVPVLPPIKNKIATATLGAQSGINKQGRTVSTHAQINVSNNYYPILRAPTVGSQIPDDVMMLEDAAIVSIIMVSEKAVVENSEQGNDNALALSTRDEPSGLSLGEKVRVVAELEESIDENRPDAFGKAGPTHIERTPASIIESLHAESNNNGVTRSSQVPVDNCPSTITINNQDPAFIRVEQLIKETGGGTVAMNIIKSNHQGVMCSQPTLSTLYLMPSRRMSKTNSR